MFVASLIFAAATATTAATPTETFMQRLVNIGFGQHKTVTVGALPPGWQSPVPLPQSIPIIGSVFTPKFATDVYYQPVDAAAAAKAYAAQLKAAGYVQHFGTPGSGGFLYARVAENLTIMCRDGAGLSFRVVASDDLRVNVPAAGAGNICADAQPRLTTPVPNLLAPPNTTIAESGSSVGWGMGENPPGGTTEMRSSAVVRSTLPLKQLMSEFAAQMQGAHWNAGSPFISPQGASQSFTFGAGASKWNATLMFVREARNTYRAAIDAVCTGTLPSVTPQPDVSAVRPLTHMIHVNEPATLALARRIASTYASDGTATLYPRALPQNLDRNLPLPQGDLIGSAVTGVITSLYYDVTSAQYSAYLARLAQMGWKMLAVMPHAGGFKGSIADATTFCKRGLPEITTLVRQNSNELTIHTSPVTSSSCQSQQSIETLSQRAPLPDLKAPANATMQFGTGVPGGTSSASIVTSLPLADVLAKFASQMTAADWSASPPLANDAIGSQTFTTTQNGAQWQAVLTVYRSRSDAKTYYAFIDVTRL